MITCYAELTKSKSVRLIEAFAAGCGGRLATTDAATLEPGAAVFYGVRPRWRHLWDQAREEGRDWYYIDNAYFDAARERYFRVTRNALQADGLQACWSGEGMRRLQALGITLRDWQRGGRHIVVCPQSEEFMRDAGGVEGDWLADVTNRLRASTGRELRIRSKRAARSLHEDLRGAWALVTHMSCAAVEALIVGVPVFCTGRCAAQWMGTSELSRIEAPLYPERRAIWAAILAENQWTEAEMRDGTAWRALHG